MKDKMRLASDLVDSLCENDIIRGFDMISDIVSEPGAAQRIEFGFLDNSLFSARKHASDDKPAIRDSVAGMLIGVGQMDGSWREAAIETADEINLQPSETAHSVAAKVYAGLGH
jgi:hypothetical protein